LPELSAVDRPGKTGKIQVMPFLRNRLSGGAIWSMIALALWMSFPSTGCRCADGGFKYFCSHGQSGLNQPTAADSSVTKVDCCQHRNAVTQTDNCDHSALAGSQISSRGCTPITNAPAVAPVPPSTHITHDSTIALGTVLFDFSPTLASLTATQPATIATGPPVDLVVSLHCFLI
jgi:hypothetical protein